MGEGLDLNEKTNCVKHVRGRRWYSAFGKIKIEKGKFEWKIKLKALPSSGSNSITMGIIESDKVDEGLRRFIGGRSPNFGQFGYGYYSCDGHSESSNKSSIYGEKYES
eukprot:161693_1